MYYQTVISVLLLRSKHLSEIKNDFECGVFLTLYHSPKQRFFRLLATFIFCLKHILRGLLFSWPLYLLALATMFMSADFWWMILFIIPALYVSWLILNQGLREDYEEYVEGYILTFAYMNK